MAVDAFASEVLADGPIGYWRLNAPPGSSQALDASGNGHNGAATGGVTFGLPGIHGGDTAAHFDGLTGRIIVNNSDPLSPPHISIEAKVRWDGPHPDIPAVGQRILEKSSYPQLAQYGLGVRNGHAAFEIRRVGETVDQYLEGSIPLQQGVESHIVGTYDGDKLRLYVNGVQDSNELVAPGTISPKEYTPANVIESGVGIGNQTERDRPFHGLIDEVALYPTALSAERIRAHYNSQFTEPEVFQYAAKIICGRSNGEIVAEGQYFTAVNMHNPTYREVSFRVKTAIALPGLKSAPDTVSAFRDGGLGPDEALELDCRQIFDLAGTEREFLKGFVVIESQSELDVVTVYTAAGQHQVSTMHTERVPARRQPANGSRE